MDVDIDSELREAYRTILRCIGEDPSRPGLLQTPARAAKAMRVLTSGYTETPRDVAGSALFPVVDDAKQLSMDVCHPAAASSMDDEATRNTGLGLVLVRDITVNSLCEHHLLPFFGRAHIGYLPGGAVLGLSKLARVADMFARRLQMQERLTHQICEGINEAAEARGVAVVLECSHMCMCGRGVRQPEASTTTSAAVGALCEPCWSTEFYGHLARPAGRL